MKLRFLSTRERYDSGCIVANGPFGSCCWTLVLRARIFWPMEEYDADLVSGLLSLARSDEINFGIA